MASVLSQDRFSEQDNMLWPKCSFQRSNTLRVGTSRNGIYSRNSWIYGYEKKESYCLK